MIMNTRTLILITAMTLPTIAAWFYFIVCAGHPAAAWVYGSTKIAMAVIPLFVWWRYGLDKLQRSNSASLSLARIVSEGVMTGLLMAAGIITLALGPMATLIAEATPRIAGKVNEFGIGSASTYVLATVVISILHSAFEEYYWRWYVFRALAARLPISVAHLLAGLAFAGHHIIVAGVYAGVAVGVVLGLVVGAAGIAWSLLFRRHGSLIGCWIAHACCDLALMWIGWRALHQ